MNPENIQGCWHKPTEVKRRTLGRLRYYAVHSPDENSNIPISWVRFCFCWSHEECYHLLQWEQNYKFKQVPWTMLLFLNVAVEMFSFFDRPFWSVIWYAHVQNYCVNTDAHCTQAEYVHLFGERYGYGDFKSYQKAHFSTKICRGHPACQPSVWILLLGSWAARFEQL